MLIYDSHCHLAALSADLRCYPIAVPAIRLADNRPLAAYRQQNPQAKIGCGIHPWFLENNLDLSTLKQQLRTAILDYQPDFLGETGLDALKPNFELQLAALQIHLELAVEFQLPLVLHCVRAYNQLLHSLVDFPQAFGVVHAFNGNTQQALQLAKKNMSLGIGSNILNGNSQLAKSVAKFNLAQLLLESDAPYMPALAKTTSSSNDCLIYAQRLAQLQKKSLMTIINEANQNYQRLFTQRTATTRI